MVIFISAVVSEFIIQRSSCQYTSKILIRQCVILLVLCMLRNVYNLVFTFNDTCIRMTMTMIMHKYENIDMLISL